MRVPPGKRELIATLEASGQNPWVYEGDEGTSLVVLPYGGRILGLYENASDENFLWTNEALDQVESAKAYFPSEVWKNSGGDRTWLGPEVDFFYPNYPDCTTYFQQRSLDPGNYRPTCSSPKQFTLENELQLRAAWTRHDWHLRMTKTVSPTPNPLREISQGEPEGVRYAGYRLHTALVIEGSPPPESHINLWNLLQLPGGGEMIVPTYFRTQPTTFFGDISPENLCTEDHVVRYQMGDPGLQKISVKAAALTGRAGYVRRHGDHWDLVVRNFAVDPSESYLDRWPTQMDDFGYAFQACNINTPDFGQFSELEYHVPAIGGTTQRTRSDDVSQVWAYRGNKQGIRELARLLLNATI